MKIYLDGISTSRIYLDGTSTPRIYLNSIYIHTQKYISIHKILSRTEQILATKRFIVRLQRQFIYKVLKIFTLTTPLPYLSPHTIHPPFPFPPGIEGYPRLASFHELASVNKLAGVLNASLS